MSRPSARLQLPIYRTKCDLKTVSSRPTLGVLPYNAGLETQAEPYQQRWNCFVSQEATPQDAGQASNGKTLNVEE